LVINLPLAGAKCTNIAGGMDYKKLIIWGLSAGIAWALYVVWPTPYSYQVVKGDTYRIFRLTGSWEKRVSSGWKSVEPVTYVSPSDRLHEVGIDSAAKK
jgi:hypothetical protein